MASGRKHAHASMMVINLYVVIAVVLVGMAAVSLHIVLGLLLGLLLGLYANPDVRDQEDVRNHGEHLVDRHFGKTAGMLWTLYWYPLAWLIPHRSKWSHWPPLATPIAWLYLFAPVLAVTWWWFDEYLATVAVVSIAALPGWAIQDTVHLAQDGWKIR